MFTSSVYMADLDGDNNEFASSAYMGDSGYETVELTLSRPLTETVTVYISILDEGKNIFVKFTINFIIYYRLK